MPRELICTVSETPTVSTKLSAEIRELQGLLRSRQKGATELRCGEPVQYICFSQFEITGLYHVDATVFELVNRWWRHRHDKGPQCIVRARGEAALVVCCPNALQTPASSSPVVVLVHLLLVIIATYAIYTNFYLVYHDWCHSKLSSLVALAR